MSQFGEYLRGARESQSISLEQISASTRISVRLLEALETERFDILPGGVFTISFARQYARHVGLDEDEAVARLKQVTKPLELALGEWRGKPRESDDAGAKIAELLTDFVRRHRLTLTGGFVTVALLAGGFIFFQTNESRETRLASQALETSPSTIARSVPGQAASASTTQDDPSGEAPKLEVVSGLSSEPAAPEPSKAIQLELRLTDRAWVRVVVDGQRVLEDNLEPGFVRMIKAQQSVQLVIGNAGGVSVALNGEAMSPIGPPGHVRRVDVSLSGMEVVDIPPKPAEAPPQGKISATQT